MAGKHQQRSLRNRLRGWRLMDLRAWYKDASCYWWS